jgi:hypothetical protein
MRTEKSAECCPACVTYAHPWQRLERWRFAALKRLVKAGVIPRTPARYSFTPSEAAAELAIFLGHHVPECPGRAWEYLRGQYDPKRIPPSKDCRRMDRKRGVR